MSQLRQQTKAHLLEEINLREIVVLRLKQKMDADQAWIDLLTAEMSQLAQTVEILERQEQGQLGRIVASLNGFSGQKALMASAPVKMKRDFNTVFAQVFLYRGVHCKLTIGEITQTGLDLQLILPHLKRAFGAEPGKILERKGFRVLRRVRQETQKEYRYALTKAAIRRLEGRCGNLSQFKGKLEQVTGLAGLFEKRL